MNTSRRHFLKAAASLSSLGGVVGSQFSAPFAMTLAGVGALAGEKAGAATVDGGYKALVCLFLQGGNDSHNWIVPTDPAGYADYVRARRELALSYTSLRAANSTLQGAGRSFGMPAELAPLHKWYQAGKAAVVSNVGTLVVPTTKADFDAGNNLPPKLFSHNDQQSLWQSMSPEGAKSGWGGRMGDILMSANQYPVFTAISATGNVAFLAGDQISQFQVGSEGPISIRGLGSGSMFGSSQTANILRRSIESAGTNALETEYLKTVQRSIAHDNTLKSALASSSAVPQPSGEVTLSSGRTVSIATDSLAKQLRVVAQLMGSARSLGMRRQVFMVSIPGFDTHSNQLPQAAILMSRVAQSIDYFLTTVSAMGMLNNVTLFTASDFGRTLTTNGAGSDHGWGSHHFVAGGAVKGGEIYGRFPSLALGSSDDVGSGRLLPSTSVAEYAAVMGGWMGLNANELATVLPGLTNFNRSNLSFL
ncbi:DUF1501 domain-containing protein [Aquincola tertiaricarbonis]|uniref:DUF1501 domain-containing protein n=1 Tax=Aquincola tertiaricarbonis TaxID=391953 RepID=A0ABY4SAL1_AQUTE|nr:DUF1501 domain-containing protein [Aquincola tertiaricarbonis]URI09504.1 DUF1501 domain-containing protein [Aquincola tertiaricarbonis]